jgi:predicted PolB exonuclease-like 3'-5' exonuclease
MKRLVLDIETVPLCKGEADTEDKKAALDALSGRIVCIGGILVEEFTPVAAFTLVAKDERAILNDFWQRLERYRVKSFVTHNGLTFDLPFIWRRSVIHQVKPRLQLDLRRYRTDLVYDTMCVWGNWESRGNVSLDTLSQALGLGSKNGSGADVLNLWENARFQELADYCLYDCWLTYGCYCKMNFVAPVPVHLITRESICAASESNPPESGLEAILSPA